MGSVSSTSAPEAQLNIVHNLLPHRYVSFKLFVSTVPLLTCSHGVHIPMRVRAQSRVPCPVRRHRVRFPRSSRLPRRRVPVRVRAHLRVNHTVRHVAGLEQLDRRFAWFRALLAAAEARLGASIPSSWNHAPHLRQQENVYSDGDIQPRTPAA